MRHCLDNSLKNCLPKRVFEKVWVVRELCVPCGRYGRFEAGLFSEPVAFKGLEAVKVVFQGGPSRPSLDPPGPPTVCELIWPFSVNSPANPAIFIRMHVRMYARTHAKNATPARNMPIPSRILG